MSFTRGVSPTTALASVIFWSGIAAHLPSEAVEFETEDAIKEKQASGWRNENLRATSEKLLGKTFWFEPGKDVSSPIKFLESIPKEVLDRPPTFRPTGKVSFVVKNIITVKLRPSSLDSYFVEVVFDGGKTGYIEAPVARDPFMIYTFRSAGSDAIYTEEPDALRERERVEAAELERKEKAEAKALAARGGVRVGMSKAQALKSSWGRPSSINKTTTARGVREQWVYEGGNYLYFDNGTLTAIQN